MGVYLVEIGGEEHMTRKEQIMAASAGRAHAMTMINLYGAFGDWKNYFNACNLFHMYDELIASLKKSK